MSGKPASPACSRSCHRQSRNDPSRSSNGSRQRSATRTAGPNRSSPGSPRRSPTSSARKRSGPTTGTCTPTSATARSRAATAQPTKLFTAVQAGAWAVGLPPAPHHDDQRCTADGQARAVLALWLAAAATPDGAELLRDLSSEGASSSGALTFDEWDNPPMWGVIYTASDASLAIAMLEQPARPLADALAERLAALGRPGHAVDRSRTASRTSRTTQHSTNGYLPMISGTRHLAAVLTWKPLAATAVATAAWLALIERPSPVAALGRGRGRRRSNAVRSRRHRRRDAPIVARHAAPTPGSPSRAGSAVARLVVGARPHHRAHARPSTCRWPRTRCNSSRSLASALAGASTASSADSDRARGGTIGALAVIICFGTAIPPRARHSNSCPPTPPPPTLGGNSSSSSPSPLAIQLGGSIDPARRTTLRLRRSLVQRAHRWPYGR